VFEFIDRALVTIASRAVPPLKLRQASRLGPVCPDQGHAYAEAPADKLDPAPAFAKAADAQARKPTARPPAGGSCPAQAYWRAIPDRGNFLVSISDLEKMRR
jgi:hypothetical protein